MKGLRWKGKEGERKGERWWGKEGRREEGREKGRERKGGKWREKEKGREGGGESGREGGSQEDRRSYSIVQLIVQSVDGILTGRVTERTENMRVEEGGRTYSTRVSPQLNTITNNTNPHVV